MRVISQAKYWANLIGRIISVSASREACIKFEYQYNGLKLQKPEEWKFPLNRCEFVPDFAAIIRPTAFIETVRPPDEVEYEEVN